MSKRARKVTDQTGEAAIANVADANQGRNHYMTYQVYYLIDNDEGPPNRYLADIGADWYPTANVGKAVNMVKANLPAHIANAGRELRIEMRHSSADCHSCRS